MALSDSQKSNFLFKKSQGKGTSDVTRLFFEEPNDGRPAVFVDQVWNQSDLIPTTRPGTLNPGVGDGTTDGVVEIREDLSLTLVPGTTNAFTDAALVDAIPFNFGDGTYNYILKDNLNNPIPFGTGDFLLDFEAGLLTFFGTLPANMPPKITFWRYIGTKGAGGGGASSLQDAYDGGNTIAATVASTGGIVLSTNENISTTGSPDLLLIDLQTGGDVDNAALYVRAGDVDIPHVFLVEYNGGVSNFVTDAARITNTGNAGCSLLRLENQGVIDPSGEGVLFVNQNNASIAKPSAVIRQAGDTVTLEIDRAVGQDGADIRLPNNRTADPTTLVDGDIWHNTTSNRIKTRMNGATETLAFERTATESKDSGTPDTISATATLTILTGSGNAAFTLPTQADRLEVNVKSISSGSPTLTAGGANIYDQNGVAQTSLTLNQGDSFTLISDATSWYET